MIKQLMKISSIIIALIISFSSFSIAQDAMNTEPTEEKIHQFTRNYIEQQYEEDGYFKLYDPATNRTLYLKNATEIRHVKCALGDNMYYNCALFESKSGNVYDIDFFIKWDGNNLKTTEVVLHKTNTKPRYVWDLDKSIGFWNALTVCGVDKSIKWTGEKQFDNTNIVYDEETVTKPVYVWFKDDKTGKWKALDVCYKVDQGIADIYNSNRKVQ